MSVYAYTGPRLGLIPNDTYVDQQWHLKRTDTFAAWRMLGRRGDPDVSIGIVDISYDPRADSPIPHYVQVTDEPFTVGLDGTVRLKYPPDVARPITITIGGLSRTIVSATKPALGYVIGDDVPPPLPIADGYVGLTWHPVVSYYRTSTPAAPLRVARWDYSAVLTFSDTDKGASGTATYSDRRIRNLWNDAYDAVGATDWNYPAEMHGNGVAAVIGGITDNGVGTAGMCPDCRLLYFATDGGEAFNVGGGFGWLADQMPAGKAFIVSASVGNTLLNPPATDPDYMERWGAKRIKDTGGVLFIAAENADSQLPIPAPFPLGSGHYGGVGDPYLPGAIAVGASQNNDDRWVGFAGDSHFDVSPGSNYGANVTLVAPGLNLLAQYVYNATSVQGWFAHTSAATPVAAGAGGLVLTANPDLVADIVKAIILATTDRSYGSATGTPGAPGSGISGAWATVFPNAGIVNVGRAVAKALSTLSPSAHDARFPAFAGRRVFPHLGIFKTGTWARKSEWAYNASPTYDVGDGPWNHTTIDPATRTSQTTLNGPIALNLAAYTADGSTPTVRLKLNGELVREVPSGTTLTATATYDGSTALPLTLEAEDASGNITTETYTDVLVTSLAVEAAPTGDLALSSAVAFDTNAGSLQIASEGIGNAAFGSAADAESLPGHYLARNLSLGRSWVAGPYAQIPIYGGDVALGLTQGYSADAVSAQVGAAILASALGHSSDAISAQVAAGQFNAAQGFTADAVSLASLLGDAAFAAGASFVTDAVTGHVVALSLGTGHTLVLDAGYQDALNAAGALDLSMLHGQAQDAAYRGPDLVSDQTIAALLGLDCDAAFGPRYDAEQSVDALLAFATDARFSGTPAVVYPPIICTLPDLTVIGMKPDLAVVRELQDLTFICDSAEVSDD